MWKALTILFLAVSHLSASAQNVQWAVFLKREGRQDKEVVRLPREKGVPFRYETSIDDVKISVTLSPADGYTIFKAEAVALGQDQKIFFSLRGSYAKGDPWNFNGVVESPEIFRQSPHDINAWIVTSIAEQAAPIIALHNKVGFEVALNGSPYLYDNFTSQGFFPSYRYMELSSGDDGQTPGMKPDTAKNLSLDYNAEKTQIFTPGKVSKHYHIISTSKSHTFDGVIFTMFGNSLNALRKGVNTKVADHYSPEPIDNYFGKLSFATAYLNLRTNDSGKSKVWVVPSVEYSNTQYGRDAFWISMMLDKSVQSECLKSELSKVNHYAEYPLFAVLWAYRLYTAGIKSDPALLQPYVDAIQQRSRNSSYYSFTEEDGRQDFQYWGDVMAFEKDDVLTYNQGLFVLAIKAAHRMGLKTSIDTVQALRNYKDSFNQKLGFYPISKKKNFVLGPDPLVPDLLARIYFNEPLTDSVSLRKHYDKLIANSKTPYGFKILARADGSFLHPEEYDVAGYVSQVNREKTPDGSYLRGGSFFLYDNLFLIDAYLQNIPGAEENLIWRIGVDFQIGNTTFETINTVTGEPWKPNMGWNVAIFSIWNDLVKKGKADRSLFKAIDKISNSK